MVTPVFLPRLQDNISLPITIWSLETPTLEVTDGNHSIEATSTVPAKAVIDSLQFEMIEFAGFEFSIIHVYTVDPSPEVNYFRARLSYNHSDYYDSGNVIADVVNTNGVIDVPLGGVPFLQGDTITVEFWSLDEAGYQFYRTFDGAADSNPSSTSSPFNVSSNVIGGLGLFTVYQRDEYTLIVD
jgi:hypothetical protein